LQTKDPQGEYLGVGEIKSNRAEFGVVVSDILDKMSAAEKREKVMVIDCDLEVLHLHSPPTLPTYDALENLKVSAILLFFIYPLLLSYLPAAFFIRSFSQGSTGLNTIRKRHPDIFVRGGIMERGNISAAAGFGMKKGQQVIAGVDAKCNHNIWHNRRPLYLVDLQTSHRKFFYI
jgi:hypothetical protein